MMRTATAATSVTNDPRWTAVISRDRRADGTFFYAVKTTGVYCRPSCSARRANPKNVSFYATPAAAEAAGFRPCRRCKPAGASLDQQHAALIARACRHIEASDAPLRLDMLAAQAGLSPYHFHRVFKSITGVTPRAYAAARRVTRVQAELKSGATVTDALYAAGFNSGSRFYESSNAVLGMPPAAYRNGGADAEICFAVGECSLGSILVAQTVRGICAILLGDDPDGLVRDVQARFPRATLIPRNRGFEQTIARVIAAVDAPGLGLDLPLDVRGTAFQQRVWQALREVPPGTTVTYAEIARRVGAPKSARAVAQACAANPVAVAIPCHRVVRTGGALSGYRWGVERKRDLLARERGTGS